MFMTKKSKSSVKNIITINTQRDAYYTYRKDTLKPLNRLSYNTTNFIVSYLANKDLINTTVYLSRSIQDSDIDEALTFKAYEELGLDQARSYVVSYTEMEGTSEEKEYHIFVADPEVLDSIYLPIKEKTKYLDLVLPAPLLYQVLYKRDILPKQSTHCFIYFTKHDAFVTLYKNGKLLYSKTIEYSLEQIYDKYCEMVGEKVDHNEFFTILESEALKTKNSDYQQNFMKIFGEIFITINDIIIYAKRAFQLENIDHVYIGSVQGPIVGLDEYSQNYLGLQSSELNFNYNIKSNEWYTDQLQYMMVLSAQEYMRDPEDLVNLTTFTRAPSFLNRAGGQFIILTFAAISLGLALPIGYVIASYMNDTKNLLLTKENAKLTGITTKYKKIISEKTSQIKVLEEKIAIKRDIYSAKTGTLKSIFNKKVNYRLKSGMLYTIANELAQFKVKVDLIYSKENTLWVSLISDRDIDVTQLVKYISEAHFDEINAIDIELIEKDVKGNYYKGLLKVELR